MEIPESARLTDGQIVDSWTGAWRPSLGRVSYGVRRVADAASEKTWPVAKQVGFEMGIEQGRAEERRDIQAIMNEASDLRVLERRIADYLGE